MTQPENMGETIPEDGEKLFAVYRGWSGWRSGEVIKQTAKKTVVRESSHDAHLMTGAVRCFLPATAAAKLIEKLKSSEAQLREDTQHATRRHNERVDKFCADATAAAIRKPTP